MQPKNKQKNNPQNNSRNNKKKNQELKCAFNKLEEWQASRVKLLALSHKLKNNNKINKNKTLT